MDTHRPHRGLVGPVILISLGVLFLMNNLGYLNWSVWEVILRLWPVYLVGIGLDILIGRRSTVGSLIVVALMVALLAGGVWLMNNQAVGGQPLQQKSFSQSLGGAKSADVTIRFGVGTLKVDGTGGANNLIEGQATQDAAQNVRSSFNLAGDRATYDLSSTGPAVFPILGPSYTRWGWDLKLNPNVPLNLNINAGVSQSSLDLSQVTVSTLKLEMGVGDVTLTLPAQGSYTADVQGGVGNLKIYLPAGLAARIQMESWLGGASVSGGAVKTGDRLYETADYSTSKNRVDLHVGGGLGSVVVYVGGAGN